MSKSEVRVRRHTYILSWGRYKGIIFHTQAKDNQHQTAIMRTAMQVLHSKMTAIINTVDLMRQRCTSRMQLNKQKYKKRTINDERNQSIIIW